MHRRSLLLAALLAPGLATRARAASGTPGVVATFSVLGDMVNQIAGKDVALTTIVGPDGDTEAYEPTAADARALAEAGLLVMNDLNPEFEPWLPSLMNQAQFHGTKLVASNGVHTLRKAEEANAPAGVEAGGRGDRPARLARRGERHHLRGEHPGSPDPARPGARGRLSHARRRLPRAGRRPRRLGQAAPRRRAPGPAQGHHLA